MLLFSHSSSEAQTKLAKIIAENERLNVRGEQKLEHHMQGVCDAMSQLERGAREQNLALRKFSKNVKRSTSPDMSVINRQSEIMAGLLDNISALTRELRFSI